MRITTKTIIAMTMLGLATAPCGCTNSFSVRVEKLVGISRNLAPDGSADAALVTTRHVLADLIALCIECREACAPDDLTCTLSALAAVRDQATALLPAGGRTPAWRRLRRLQAGRRLCDQSRRPDVRRGLACPGGGTGGDGG